MELIYGLKNGELVHIDKVENGIQCNCVCPNCKSKLIAKNGGNVLVHHFAHLNNADCHGYGETIIHKLAKKIIGERMYIDLPQYNFKNKFIPQSRLKIVKIEFEKKMEDIVPDIYVELENKEKYGIEIFYSHKVDEIKRKKIEKLRINVIEIDLSSLNSMEKDTIDFEINFKNTKWIYCQYGEKLEKDWKNYVEKINTYLFNNELIYCPRFNQKININSYCKKCEYFYDTLNKKNILCGYKNNLKNIEDYKHLYKTNKISSIREDYDGLMKHNEYRKSKKFFRENRPICPNCGQWYKKIKIFGKIYYKCSKCGKRESKKKYRNRIIQE